VADKLIERDLKEVGTDLGQDVRASFPEADFFLDATKPGGYASQVERFVNLLFGHPYVTPSVDEYGMFHARAAALRSADLSRQVGAVITSDDGEIIAAGCNEVPSAGGGSVWDGEPERTDYRDYRIGHDSTAWMKHELVAEVFSRLQGWLVPELRDLSPSKLASKALYDGDPPPLKGTRADSLLEFGRIVHAEMFAITEAARRGLTVRNARLYCTTFPCHMCARHIVASGINQVIYIEPYPKSMAKELYRKSIRVDDDEEADDGAVRFRPFVGVSPRKFIEFFEMNPRKDRRGHVIQWDGSRAAPRIRRMVAYTDSENTFMTLVGQLVASAEAFLNGSSKEVRSDE
jgi:cytidine deaminase